MRRNLTLIKELRGDGHRFSVRDFVSGMMGNSSRLYGRFKTAAQAREAFGDQIRFDYSGCKHGNIPILCPKCAAMEAA